MSSFYKGLEIDVAFIPAGKGIDKQQIESSFIGEFLERYNNFSTDNYLETSETVNAKEAFELFYGKCRFLAHDAKFKVLKDEEGRPFPIVALHMDVNTFFEPFFYLHKEELKGLGLGVGFNKENAILHSLTEAIEKYYIFEYKNALNKNEILKKFNPYILKGEEFVEEVPVFIPKKSLIPTVIVDYFGQICGGSSLSELVALNRALAEAFPHNFYEGENEKEIGKHKRFIDYLKSNGAKMISQESLCKNYSTGDVRKDIEIIKDVLEANEFTYSIVNASKNTLYHFYQTLILDLIE